MQVTCTLKQVSPNDIIEKMGEIEMLSIVDIKKELGDNIYIYPLHIESIKSNSVDLRVSRFAWSLNTKSRIGNDEYIIIPPHDTGLVYSEESIFVSNRIGGSYNSKVTLVSKGAGHIGTTLDAQYIGCSLVAIHNHSSVELKLKIGSEFVTLHFWYLHSPDYNNAPSHDNEPGHPRMLNGFNGVEEYIEWRDKNTWATRKKDLFLKMKESEEYRRCKAEYQKELDEFNKGILKRRTRNYFKVLGIIAAIFLILIIPAYAVDCGWISDIIQEIIGKVVLPIAVAIISTFTFLDFKSKE